jgi:IclR family transcriptional regulator, pca regulon regulatory protein
MAPDRDAMTINERDYVRSLARGLAVVRAFDNHGRSMTLAEVADAAQISRPAARRILLTLAELGYVRGDNGSYELSPRILALGQAYLSSLSFVDVAQAHMKDLAAETNEAVGLTILDGSDIVFVARVGAQRIMSSVLVVGSRLPAYATSMGRVLLADLPEAEQEARLRAGSLVAYTPRTETDVEALLGILAQVRRQGWSAVDQELEDGLRSVAVAIRDSSGTCIAAMASSCHASRVSTETLTCDVLPVVRRIGAQISGAMGFMGEEPAGAPVSRSARP